MTVYKNFRIRTIPDKNGKKRYKGSMDWYDAQGKRHETTRNSKCRLKKDAVKELEQWRDKMIAQGKKSLSIGTATRKKTVEQVVTEYLNYQKQRGKLEDSTYSSQINMLKSRCFPYIGDTQFDELTKDEAEAWISSLYKDGLSDNYIHGVYSHVAKVYKYWYRQGELALNIFEMIDTPSKGKSRKTYLDPDQFDNLLECLNDQYAVSDPLYIAVELACLAGLRRGEICGLRWRDIDFNKGTIHVSSAIGVTSDGSYTKAPKNASSNREFPVVPQLIEVLIARMVAVQNEYGTVQNEWFVCGKASTYLSPTNLSRLFKEFIVDNGLVDHYGQEVKLHSLRHNFATLGVQSHMDIASLSKMMGHASKALTLDTYADASPKAMKQASEDLFKMFKQESEMLENV